MEESSVGKPITIAGLTLIPLEKVRVVRFRRLKGLSFFVSKQPVGIVIISPKEKTAISIDGAQVSLDSYCREFDGLQEVLDTL